MNNLLKRRLSLLLLAAFAILSAAVLLIERHAKNPLYPALDTLSRVTLADRWSHPEMLHIRTLGADAVPDLRRVLAEKDNRRTAFLLWLGGKWPRATNYISNFPNAALLLERRWTACQALQSLGPAARPAVPELIDIFKRGDVGDWNAGSTALYAIGIDAEIAERLAAAIEEGAPDNAQPQMIWMIQSLPVLGPFEF